MNCLIDTIGLTGCGTSTPASGLYINSLPGINLEAIEKIADSDQKTYVNVWSDIQVRAAKKFGVDVVALFNKRFNIKTISSSLDLGNIIDVSSTTAPAAQYRGIIFDLDFGLNGWTKNSALQLHYLQTLNFYSGANYGATTIKVYDVDTGSEVDSFSHTLVSGWNTISVNKYYIQRRIFVGINSTAITSVSLEVRNECDDCGVRVSGGVLSIGADISTLEEGSDTYGMSAVYSVHCKIDPVVCNNLSAFYNSWLYCLGSEIQTETLYSPRINAKTIDRDRAKELKDYFDREYEQSLMLSVDGINLDVDDYCLLCNDTYQVVENKP